MFKENFVCSQKLRNEIHKQNNKKHSLIRNERLSLMEIILILIGFKKDAINKNVHEL